MPAKSQKQQMFMGMVRSCQKTGKCASPAVSKAAHSMKSKDVEHFAKTKRKGLPVKVGKKGFFDENYSFLNWLENVEASDGDPGAEFYDMAY